MKNLMTLLSFLAIGFCAAQDPKNDLLTDAVKTFDDAKDLSGMLVSTQLFKQASSSQPDSWISSYWTAFAFSQCGRLTETPLAYYDTAQLYLDKTKEKINSLDDSQKSDVYALESLISGLKSGPYWAQGDRENGMKFSAIENQSLSKAMALNMDNPRVYLLTGTGLISDGKRIQNDGYILAGRKMLEIARQKYEANDLDDALYPNWGHGWINFWMANSKLPE
ncbi:MAG: hypothetical protein AAF391_09255 [Bacteroidota bacterium]